MFAPAPAGGSQNGGTPTMTTRSRRRQRPMSSDASLPPPKSKRLRSTRAQDSAQPVAEPASNPETYEVKSTQSNATEAKPDGIDTPVPFPRQQELSVRSKKPRTGDRLHKGDGTTLLATNVAFEVRKLPALPERLKLDVTSRQHGLVDSSIGSALSLTHTHAIVWPYTSATLSPEAFVFTLPYPSKYSTDPLPLGSLVSPSASSPEPGLVVVMPMSGKISYWESISSATTLDFMRQQRTGVEDTITGMFSGEYVTEIVNVEAAAGFILVFSSGRLAYLSVRDAQGRPKITVQFLRTSLGPITSGFFGSLRHVLSNSSIQSDIAAVRAEQSFTQGECTVVAATSKGRVNAWRIHRGGHYDLLADVDIKNAVLDAFRHLDPSTVAPEPDSFKIIDFCFVPKGMSSKYTDMSKLRQLPASNEQQHILLLTSHEMPSDARVGCLYNLVEVVIQNGESPETALDIGMVRPITSYSVPSSSHALAKPRLYLPRPAVVAFVVFDHAVVVASIALPPMSPDSQIMEDNHALPAAFEDVIELRRDPTLEIVGSGFEEPQIYDAGFDEVRPVRVKPKNPTAVLLVRGVGVLRVAVTDYPRFASITPPKLTAKVKLEQAVFFGIKPDNPLIFDVQHNIRFSDKEYGEAALELSEDILTSTGPNLTQMAARLEANLKDRVGYLDKMMAHLRSIGVVLDRKTKWQLLWNAEKMHVASTLWQKHEEFLHRRPADLKQTIVAEIVEFIRSEEKSKPDPAKGETDELRHWFMHDINRMELFIAWGYEVIKNHTQAKADTITLSWWVFEAAALYSSTIQAAYVFRQQHLELYGLQMEKLDHGVLDGDYSTLPTPWTANKFIANNVKREVELATQWVKQDTEGLPDDLKDMMLQLRAILPDLTTIYLSVLQELARWKLASGNPQLVTDGRNYIDLYNKDRYDKVVLLSQSDNWESAIKLAETHRSLQALAEVLIREIDGLRDTLSAPESTEAMIEKAESKMAEKESKVRQCFETYGEEFAFPFYDYLYTTYGVDALLEYEGDKTFKTVYLRTRPQLAQISWINDVVGEEDIDRAANTLLELGLSDDQHIWNKKIELSLGKLARLAESPYPAIQDVPSDETVKDARVEMYDRQLELVNIQNEFYETQVYPFIMLAVDEAEEMNIIRKSFAPQYPKKYKVLSQLFEDAMKRLLSHEALDPLTLIDLLTMVSLPGDTKEGIADQFFLAVEVAYNGLDGDERFQAEQLIWRRCYLREDWKIINETSMKDDEETLDVLGSTDLFQLYCTLHACQINSKGTIVHRRISPSEATGVYTQTLDRRFTNMERNYRDKMLEAMRYEDSILNKHIDKHRLVNWANEARRFAEKAVEEI